MTLLLAALALLLAPASAQVLWPQYNRSDSLGAWEYNPAENFTALYHYRMNEVNETEFVEELSKHKKPLKWLFKMLKCKVDKTRCLRKLRSLRGLQESSENYIRVLFGDNEGPSVSAAAKSIFQQAAGRLRGIIFISIMNKQSLEDLLCC